MTKSTGVNLPKVRWDAALSEVVELLYPDMVTAQLAELIGVSKSAVYQRATLLGLHKSPTFVADIARARMTPDHPGRAHVFAGGHTPWNKGTKGLQLGGEATQFKKGHKPHTWLPIGSYRISGDGQLERKVNDLPGANHVRWHPVARLVWEAAHGPVPKGHMVVFKPGQRTKILSEITLDRVECISRGENARRNHPRSTSPELAKLVQLRGALTRQINKRSRELQEGLS